MFSKLEAQYFYFLEWADSVVDIREQFPIDHNSTLTIANDAGINYPWVRKTGYNTVLTTDFLITVVGSDGREKLLARTLKYAKDLRGSEGQGILKKFEIERRYWKELGVDWGIVTDLQIPATLVRNIEDCHEYRELNSALNFDPQEVAEIESIIERLIPEYPNYKLSSLSARLDQSYSLEAGTSLTVIKHMLANKRLSLPANIRGLKGAQCRHFVQHNIRLAEVM